MAETYGPKIVIDMEHGRAIDPEPIEKPLEMWEIKQRNADVQEHHARRQVEAARLDRKEQAREKLRAMAKTKSALGPIADAVLELLEP